MGFGDYAEAAGEGGVGEAPVGGFDGSVGGSGRDFVDEDFGFAEDGALELVFEGHFSRDFWPKYCSENNAVYLK